jgi:hypothetical protein
MPTLFPAALDTNTELGGGFINAAPVVNPFVNIDAAYRNNSNDAMFAVQTRIGIYGDLVPLSVDWGLLGHGGTPNKGVQFAASSNVYPGLQASAGVFHHLANNVPAWHRAGDVVGTYYDLVCVGVNYSLQDAYNGGPGITTSGAVGDLQIDGTENIIFALTTAAANRFGIDGTGIDHTSPTVQLDLQSAFAAGTGALYLSHSINSLPAVTDQGSVRVITEHASDLDDTTYFYGVSSQTLRSGAAPMAGMAWSYDFMAANAIGAAGTFSTVGLFVDHDHTYGIYMPAAMDYCGIHIGSVQGVGVEIGACDTIALDIGAGSDYGIQMAAATTWDINIAQSKVKFNFNSQAADTFYLDADAVVNGRTTSNGLLSLKWESGVKTAYGVVQRMYVNNDGGSSKDGGIMFSATANTRHASSNPLAAGGEIRQYDASGITDKGDDATASWAAFYGAFDIESNVGTADAGPEIYGLRLNVTETLIGGNYHVNDGTYATPRWAIKVDEGEASLRRTYMAGPANLAKPVLHIHQADEDLGFTTFDGSGAVDATLNLSSMNAGASAVNGPMSGAGGWNFKGMVRVSIVDDNGILADGSDYWIPLYSPVP